MIYNPGKALKRAISLIPGCNAAIESFNSGWQARVLRHPCPELRALRRTSDRFLRYHHFHKQNRCLRTADHGTRFPGILREQLWPKLRHLPSAFSLEHYLDDRGHLALPIAKDRVSFVRKVDAHGCIEFNGADYFIFRLIHRKLAGFKEEPGCVRTLI